MITVFKRIRQNLISRGENGKPDKQTSRYLKYAAGEIILVVLGILIALSINNWNEGRKNRLKESILVKNILEDLKLDSIHINQSLNELSNQTQAVDNLIAKALNNQLKLNYESAGLVRYTSDFRPISKRNHAISISNLENETTRKLLLTYYLKEDDVKDIFMEYEGIIHGEIRPYLREVGMHNLKSLYTGELNNLSAPVLLHPKILDDQLQKVKFQQLLFERRLKTTSFQSLLNELKTQNQELIFILSSLIN